MKYRSTCDCVCHKEPGTWKHILPCCWPDPKPPETGEEIWDRLVYPPNDEEEDE